MATIKKKTYTVHWYSNGYCYRTTTGCDWDAVKYFRQVAKLTGDTIKYEADR